MPPIRIALATATLLALAGPLAAADSDTYVVMLGRDTISVERTTRTAARVEVEQVSRAPRVTLRHFTYDLDPKGQVTGFSIILTAPGTPPDAPPLQKITGTRTADSLFTEVRRGANVQTVRVALPAGAVIVSASSPWAMDENAMMRLARQKPDTLGAAMYFIGAPSTGWISLRRLGRDSVSLSTDRGDLFHMRVDRDGRLLGALPIAGTAKFSAERVVNLNLAATTVAWTAAEARTGAAGALSVRDTVNATAGGAALWIDYGRPSKRGRVVFGGVVPYGELWRTGANAATQFRTDRALDFGGALLPAGTYTLWTLPSATGWKFVVNSETGQWGTAHKAEKDLFTLDMTVAELSMAVERFTIGVQPNAEGGVLQLDWDTTRASIAFKTVAAAN